MNCKFELICYSIKEVFFQVYPNQKFKDEM